MRAISQETRQLLERLQEWIRTRATKRFTQREAREAFGWGDFQLRRHLARLVELEYVLVQRTGRGNQRQYELVAHGFTPVDFALTLAPESPHDHPPAGRNDPRAARLPARSRHQASPGSFDHA